MMIEDSVITDEMHRQIGMLSEPWIVEVERGAIACYAEATGDTNLIYRDEGYAKKSSYGGKQKHQRIDYSRDQFSQKLLPHLQISGKFFQDSGKISRGLSRLHEAPPKAGENVGIFSYGFGKRQAALYVLADTVQDD